MIVALDIIDRLPTELKARLEADSFFEDIPVIVAEAGNVRAELDRQQALVTTKLGRRGAAVIILQVVANDDFPNLQFGPLTLFPAFQVVEDTELNNDSNGTKKPARRIARRIRDVIKCFGAIGLIKNMEADKPCIEPVNLGDELGATAKAYQVNFRCYEASTDDLVQVQIPQFSVAGASLTLSCGTAGATIYYSTDDTYPAPATENVTQYSAPIAIPPAGLTVRACAYKTGCIASWVNRATVSPL